MTSKPEVTTQYTALPPSPTATTTVVLTFRPASNHRFLRRKLRRTLLFTFSLLFLSLSLYLLWPTDPDLHLVRAHLNQIRVRAHPSLSLDLSLSLTLRVRNRDFLSLDYHSLNVSLGYRGRELGFVRSDGGKIGARTTSYANATVVIDGLEVLHDVIYLIEDVVAGSVPFDTVSMVKGDLGFFFFKIPIQAKVSCEVFVNPKTQTIIHQNCYPE